MNPIYTILESPHRWSILGSLALGTGFLGAIMIITYGWAQWLARIWFLVGLALALYCLVRLILQWKEQVDSTIDSHGEARQ